MTERTTVTQVVQIGVESTKGTAVAANKKLPSLSIGPSVKTNIDKFAPLGNKFPTIHAQGKEWAEAPVTGSPTYSELGYVLASLLAYAAPVQQSSTTAYKQTAEIASTSEDTVKTYTVERGSAVQAEKMAYGQFTELTLTGDRDKVELSGKMLGRALSTGISLTSSPTSIEQIPILPKEVSVYLDTASGSLGSTKLTRVLKWSLQIASRFGPLWVVDAAQTSFVEAVELPVDAKLKLLVEADAAGMALLTPMRDGTTRFARIGAASSQLAGTAIPYSSQLDLALQVGAEPTQLDDTDGVYTTEFTFDVVHDAGWGKALHWELINKQTAL